MQTRRVGLQNLGQGLRHGLPSKGRTSRQQMIQRRPQPIDIASTTDAAVLGRGLFGR